MPRSVAAEARLPAYSGRSPSTDESMPIAASAASGSSEHTRTSESSSASRSLSSRAGRWWQAATTCDLGQGRLEQAGDRPAWRRDRLELAALFHEGVAHGYDEPARSSSAKGAKPSARPPPKALPSPRRRTSPPRGSHAPVRSSRGPSTGASATRDHLVGPGRVARADHDRRPCGCEAKARAPAPSGPVPPTIPTTIGHRLAQRLRPARLPGRSPRHTPSPVSSGRRGHPGRKTHLRHRRPDRRLLGIRGGQVSPRSRGPRSCSRARGADCRSRGARRGSCPTSPRSSSST